MPGKYMSGPLSTDPSEENHSITKDGSRDCTRWHQYMSVILFFFSKQLIPVSTSLGFNCDSLWTSNWNSQWVPTTPQLLRIHELVRDLTPPLHIIRLAPNLGWKSRSNSLWASCSLSQLFPPAPHWADARLKSNPRLNIFPRLMPYDYVVQDRDMLQYYEPERNWLLCSA